MPCPLVAKARGKAALNLESHLEIAGKHDQLVAFLAAKLKIPEKSVRWGLRYNLRVRGSAFEVVSASFNPERWMVGIKQWAARENQLRIAAVFMAAGAVMQTTAQDAQGGVAFRCTIRNIIMSVHVDTDGNVTLATDTGSFSDGKKLIVGMLQALSNAGITVTGIKEIEQHGGAGRQTVTDRGRLKVGEVPGENGWHTH